MDDILFVILLYSDIDVIKKTLLNDYFWQCKFKQDNIPILNTICIQEYIKISNIILTVNRLVQLLDIERDGRIDVNIEFKPTDDIIILMPESIQNDLDNISDQYIMIII